MTDSVFTIVEGEEIVAVRFRAPTRPVSLTPLPSKSATPATAFIETLPPIVALLEDKVTV